MATDYDVTLRAALLAFNYHVSPKQTNLVHRINVEEEYGAEVAVLDIFDGDEPTKAFHYSKTGTEFFMYGCRLVCSETEITMYEFNNGSTGRSVVLKGVYQTEALAALIKEFLG